MGYFDGFAGGGGSADEISYPDLVAALKTGLFAFVDVREPHEFRAGHAPGAINLPLSSFRPASLPKDKPIVLVCKAGVRSLKALDAARAAGFADIRHYRGGMDGWARSGGEIV